jgi:hypothetical protein
VAIEFGLDSAVTKLRQPARDFIGLQLIAAEATLAGQPGLPGQVPPELPVTPAPRFPLSIHPPPRR